MKWCGERLESENRVLVTVNGQLYAKLPIYEETVNHANEFNWGYTGSGPSQLAFAVLRFYFRRAKHIPDEEATKKALALYMPFKFDIIAKLPDTWEISEEEIDKWVSEKTIPVDFSEEDKKRYFDTHGTACIYCFSVQIFNIGDPQYGVDEVVQQVYCTNCGGRWFDVYARKDVIPCCSN